MTIADNSYIYLTDSECTKASSIFQLGVLFGNIFIGPVTDAFGRKLPFFSLVPATILTQVLGCYTSTKMAFFVYRFVSGFLTGTLTVVSFVYGQELLPKKVWALSGNAMPCIFALGIACLAFAGQVLDSAVKIILWTSLPFLLLCIPMIHSPESPRWLLSGGKPDKSAKVFSSLAKYNSNADHQEPVLKSSPPGPKGMNKMAML